ncbi:hypothetical protein EIP91_004233 [Steccherinum ochraceum]|uniref:F-box domain-containing protein n=1 Tax=Steccherinum ochraceum TaxID=92696 RepID=A0A4R0RC91_9APHY|nr:hypothetical protein EIP91_004233 [Steccherinum ochraceum]
MSKDELALLDARVATLEDTILQAFEELQIVKTQQRALQARCTQDTQSTLHPPPPLTIHSIPVELLIQVFACVVHSGTDAHNAFRSAVTISHVCRLWRETALQTSSLWTHIIFNKNLRGVRTCLARSKSQPITIVRGPAGKGHVRYPTLPEKSVAMKNHLEATASRWHHVNWISSDITMRHILSELNVVTSFPHLTTLDLVVDERRLFGQRFGPFGINLDAVETRMNRFPRLECMKLSQVPPTDLPPAFTPSLRYLYLHFPPKQLPEQREGSHLLRMSGLCALLHRAPNLEELVIDDCIILMDVRLRPFDQPGTGPPVLPGQRQTQGFVSPIVMRNLTRFQWDFAPGRELWKFFYFVRMPNLRQLDVVLDRSDERWSQVRGGLIPATGTMQQPISELLTHPVVRFEMLEDLRVECLDTDGLATAFRKLEFPNLQSLSMTFVELNVPSYHKYISRPASTPEGSQLPRTESIFRDPRMPNLLSLELNNFFLDAVHTKSMLQYMPALERLALDSCTNAGETVRALNSVPPGGLEIEKRQEEEWLCPALEHIALRNCHDVSYVHLCLAACQRKLSSLMDPGVSGHNTRVLIPLRTRRKRARFQSPGLGKSTAAGAERERAVWNSHERKKPRMLKTVYVEACDGFTQAGVDKMGQDVGEVIYVPKTDGSV